MFQRYLEKKEIMRLAKLLPYTTKESERQEIEKQIFFCQSLPWKTYKIYRKYSTMK